MSWKSIAECVGLWIAEGDSKTKSEITFTNSEPALISLFYRILCELFPQYACRIRLYVYSSSGNEQPFAVRPPRIRLYADKRATRPYAIVRLASVHCRNSWNEFVACALNYSGLHAAVLRGIFAGEGSIKTHRSGVRVLRISQLQSSLFEKLITSCGFEYTYKVHGRTYEISCRNQWDLAKNLRLCELHPQKKRLFEKTYEEFQQYHYSKFFLRKSVKKDLVYPRTATALAKKYSRSHARINDVLRELYVANEVLRFGIGSATYWILSSQNTLLISSKNATVLSLVCGGYQKTSEMTRYLNVGYKSTYKHLKKLQRLGLVTRDEDKQWKRLPTNKHILVI